MYTHSFIDKGRRFIVFLCLALLLPVHSQVVAANRSLSGSKLGIYISTYTASASQVLAAGPKIVVIEDPQLPTHKRMLTAIAEYKRSYPAGIVVMRVKNHSESLTFTVAQDPEVAARQYWTTVLAPALKAIPVSERRYIDYLIGPDEFTVTPSLSSVKEAAWVGSFWVTLSQEINHAGLRPVVGELPVGTPSISAIPEILDTLAPFLTKIRVMGGAWSYHAFTASGAGDRTKELGTSVRYQMFYEYFALHSPQIVDMPIILTQAGYDDAGDRSSGGWKGKLTTTAYQEWLSWFDTQLRMDARVKGAAIYKIDPGNQYDIDALTTWMTTRLRSIPNTSPVSVLNITPSPTRLPTPTEIPLTREPDPLDVHAPPPSASLIVRFRNFLNRIFSHGN